MLGGLRLTATDPRDFDTLVRQPKRCALLAYLAAAAPHGFHRRDKLLGIFWPELDQAHARAALSQALYVLRMTLGESSLVTRGDDEVGLDSTTVWCDVAAFEAAVSAGRASEAIALYQGDLLDGFFVSDAPAFEDWASRERDRLRQRASEGAWAAAEVAAADHDALSAARWGRRAVELLPEDEGLARRVMQMLHGVGNRAAALRVYEALAWRLERDYEIQPSAETQMLAESIRGEELRAATVEALARLPQPVRAIAAIPHSRSRTLATWGVGVGLMGMGVALGAGPFHRASAPPATPIRFALTFPNAPIPTGIGGPTLALSPDGSHLVHIGQRDQSSELFVRSMDDLESIPIPHTGGAIQPFVSPDGEWVGFVQAGQIRKVPMGGGPAITVCAPPLVVTGASWGPGDVIVFASGGALWRVPSGGGTPQHVASPDTSTHFYRWPEVLPDGGAAVFAVSDGVTDWLAAVRLGNGDVVHLAVEGTNPHFVPPGYLVFARRDGAVLAVRFDARRLSVTGPPIPVADGARVGSAGAAKLATSQSGTIAYASEATDQRRLAVVDRKGKSTPVPVALRNVWHPRFFGDGSRILAHSSFAESASPDLIEVDLGRATSKRLTFDGVSLSPALSPDGQRIVFARSVHLRGTGFEVGSMPAGQNRAAETLLGEQDGQMPTGFTPDGTALIVERLDPTTRGDIWILSLQAKGATARPYLRGAANERGPALSPDGRWMAYVSDETGRDEIYVGGFPTPAMPMQVSQEGGHEPRWSPNGRELFYRGPRGMMAVSIDAGQQLHPARSRLLFADNAYLSSSRQATYDVHPDGQHFLMIHRGSAQDQVVVMVNWLERKAPR
jgi:serine/threonine-protein kinase